MKIRKSFLLVITAILLTGTAFVPADGYRDEILAWHKKRTESLKREDGWLNLAGLFWLEEGPNTFGTATDSQVIFPKGKSDGLLGTLTLKNGEVILETAPGADIRTEDGTLVSTLKVFPTEKSVSLRHRSLRWTVIKRGEKYGIRLRDLESDELRNFKGIATFPIESKWKIKGRFNPAEGKQIAILDVLGHTSQQDSPGSVSFNVKGKTYTLDAVGTTDELFIIFGDKTNKKETYGSGRFLYASLSPDGTVDLDFNKSINPPCAFTPYATCPLPPKQNILEVRIEAGEKNYGLH